MKRLFPAAAVLAAFAGCTPAPILPSSSGSIAVSKDDLVLYVADADHDRVTLLDARTGSVMRHVAVARGPERVAISPVDGAVFVTSKASRTVTRLSSDGVIEAVATVGVEPVGLALSKDSQRLFVANSQSGTVSELEASSLETRQEIAVGGNPYAIAAHPDGDRLYVSDFLGARVNVVSRLSHGPTATAHLDQPPTAECPNGGGAVRMPSQAADLVLSGSGERVYVAHTQSRTGANGMSNSLAFAVAPALSTIDTGEETTLRESDQPRTTNGGTIDTSGADFPAPLLATDLDAQCAPAGHGGGMDAPSSLVADPLGEWIFVADHNSNAVAVVSATRRHDSTFLSPERGIFGVVRVGARPTGIAVSSDLKKAWVHNALDYTVSVVELKDGKLVESQVLPFASSDLPPSIDRGRRLFYSAVDARISQPTLGGVSCSSCHPDGRTDGLTWALPTTTTRFGTPEVRNTPALWRLPQTAPYAWNGSQADLPSFTSHMVQEMGGDGLSRAELADVSSYLTTLSPPDNPNQLDGTTSAHGAQVFAQSCGSCHAGDALTDGLKHNTSGQLLDTPGLVGVHATAPYLHDGSAATLEQAVSHGAALTTDDARAVTAWLRTR